jgi:agmatinase
MFKEEESEVIVIGIPSGSNGKDYLKTLRKQSWFVEIFDIYKKKNLFEKKLCDIGDMKDYEKFEKKIGDLFSQGKVPVIFTKGDIASFYACRKLKNIPNFKVVSFDAHTDLLNKYTDEKIKWIDGHSNPDVNSSTWLRRTSEIIGLQNSCIVGLRSIDEDTLKFVEENKVTYFTPREIKNNLETVKGKFYEFTRDTQLWLNIDVDVFDPSIAPSVDYPEPEGIDFEEYQEIISSIGGKVIGMTICGGNPSDTHVTEFITVRAAFEALSKT